MNITTLNLFIPQGATYVKSIHWYGGGKVGKALTGLTPGYPTSIEVTAHGLPSISETPVFIKRVRGAIRANNKNSKPANATYVDANNFLIDVDTVGQTYTSGTGSLTYYAPTDLTSYTARMQIRKYVADTTTIASLVSPTDLTIRAADGKITITIASNVTAAFDFDQAVYDLELIDSSDNVTRLIEGTVTLLKEVTR